MIQIYATLTISKTSTLLILNILLLNLLAHQLAYPDTLNRLTISLVVFLGFIRTTEAFTGFCINIRFRVQLRGFPIRFGFLSVRIGGCGEAVVNQLSCGAFLVVVNIKLSVKPKLY